MKTPKILQDFEKQLQQTNKYKLQVGWFEEPYIKTAKIQEFGSIIPVTDKMKNYFKTLNIYLSASSLIIPPRPHRKQTIRKNYKKWTKEFKHALILTKFDIKKALEILKLNVVADYKDMIVSGEFTPLSGLTLLLRQENEISGSKPLYATGELRNHIKGRVVSNG